MIQQILLSGLLLTVGTALYFLMLRRWLSAVYAKWWIVGLWVLSTSIPALFLHITPVEEQTLQYHEYEGWNQVDINDPALQACYKGADNSKEVCRCEVVQQSNIILYKPSGWYDFLLRCRAPLGWLLSIVLGVWLVDALLKWAYLWWLAYRSPKIRYELHGTVFYLLYPSHRYFPLSSFSLRRHYIIWSPLLERFNEAERDLIFLHELGHLQQRDTWVQLFWRGLGVWWWMLPPYYWLGRELNRLNEFVADEFALRWSGAGARQYAQLLVRAKEYQLQSATPTPAFTFSFAQSLLKKRVLHILDIAAASSAAATPRRSSSRWWGYLGWTALCFWGLCAWIQPILNQQHIELQTYETLQKEHHQTGKNAFCIDCLHNKSLLGN